MYGTWSAYHIHMYSCACEAKTIIRTDEHEKPWHNTLHIDYNFIFLFFYFLYIYVIICNECRIPKKIVVLRHRFYFELVAVDALGLLNKFPPSSEYYYKSYSDLKKKIMEILWSDRPSFSSGNLLKSQYLCNY